MNIGQNALAVLARLFPGFFQVAVLRLSSAVFWLVRYAVLNKYLTITKIL
jgi:hypothetical protein